MPNFRYIRATAALAVVCFAFSSGKAGAQIKELDDVLQGKTLAGQAIKGLAIAYAVRQSSKPLNEFINKVTLRNKVPQRLATKVVPILSVGKRGYIGAAQVAGPRSFVEKTQVIWQFEEGFHRGEYRVKALVPSSDINPLNLRRVERVGVSAVIDVSLGGGFDSPTRSGKMTAWRVLRAAGIAAAVVAVANPINQFINAITFNKDPMTRVVPQASFGEGAYIGGAQVTGSSSTIRQVKAVFEYWDSFDRGRYRIRVLVPVNGIDPTRIKRVEGAGVVALIDTSITEQKNISQREEPEWRPDRNQPKVRPIIISPRRDDDEEDNRNAIVIIERHDQGKHKGWYKGKHKGWEKKKKE
jgi:hypothetical protein